MSFNGPGRFRGKSRIQAEKAYARDPVTGVILGAEAFELGSGSDAVLFLHGWTSSPRELRFMAEKVAAQGFHCRGPLLRGHGLTLESLSPTRFSDYLEQVRGIFDDLAARHRRVSVCGLSMGGLLALHLAVERKVAGLVLIAPFLLPWGRTFGLPNRWLVGRVPVWGNISKSIGGPIQDPAGAEGHIAYHAMPARTMESVVVAARRFRSHAISVACPALIHHSVQDTTSDFAGSLDLIRRLGSNDKTLMAYNRGNHVLTLDFDRSRIESETTSWLLRHQADKAG